MEIDNTIVVERDYGAVREAFLAEVENDKIREMIASLDDLPYYYPQLFPRTSGWGATGETKRRIQLPAPTPRMSRREQSPARIALLHQ